MGIDITSISKKSILNMATGGVPRSDGYSSIIVIPTNRKTDSGYNTFTFIGVVEHGKYLVHLGAGADSLALEGGLLSEVLPTSNLINIFSLTGKVGISYTVSNRIIYTIK